jgi:hypothetical protein
MLLFSRIYRFISLFFAISWFSIIFAFPPTHTPRPLPPRRAEEGANSRMWPRPQTREVQAQPRVGEDFVLYDHLGDANNQCQCCKHDVRPQTFAVSQLQATGKADNRLSYRFQRSKPERCTSEVQIRGHMWLFGSSLPPGGAGERRG